MTRPAKAPLPAFLADRSLAAIGGLWLALVGGFVAYACLGCALNQTVTLRAPNVECTIHSTVSVGDGWARCGLGAPPEGVALPPAASPSPTPEPTPADPNAPTTPPQDQSCGPTLPDGGRACLQPTSASSGSSADAPRAYAEVHGANMSATTAGVLSAAITACLSGACF